MINCFIYLVDVFDNFTERLLCIDRSNMRL